MNLKNGLNFNYIWGMFMVVFYLGMFFMFVFTHLFENFNHSIRYIMGAMFLFLGIFRIISIWQRR